MATDVDANKEILLLVDRDFKFSNQPDYRALVHWSSTTHLPIHRWFRYREAYSPKLIEMLNLGEKILDPFCGGWFHNGRRSPNKPGFNRY